MATADLLTMAPKTGDRQKALDSALAQIERQFGKGSIMTLGEGAVIPGIEATSTGSIGLCSLGPISDQKAAGPQSEITTTRRFSGSRTKPTPSNSL